MGGGEGKQNSCYSWLSKRNIVAIDHHHHGRRLIVHRQHFVGCHALLLLSANSNKLAFHVISILTMGFSEVGFVFTTFPPFFTFPPRFHIRFTVRQDTFHHMKFSDFC
jgi:hypothetical protein